MILAYTAKRIFTCRQKKPPPPPPTHTHTMERLISSRSKESRVIIGLMSGTSCDGIDAACVRVHGHGSGTRVKLLSFLTVPFSEADREQIFQLFRANATLDSLVSCNMLLGNLFAKAAKMAAAAARIDNLGSDVDFIGSHGQTIRHLPATIVAAAVGDEATQAAPPQPAIPIPDETMSHYRHPGTLQIGEPSAIAYCTGVNVVGDFRPADMAAGGQGAPLLPLVDRILHSHDTKTRLLLNIGGIANVAVLPPKTRHGIVGNGDDGERDGGGGGGRGGGKVAGDATKRGIESNAAATDDVYAFDCGPGNMTVDACISILYPHLNQAFDESGLTAASGTVDQVALAKLKKHAFFTSKPPKSCGRDEFGVDFVKSFLDSYKFANAADTVATFTALTTDTIIESLRKYVLLRNSDHVIDHNSAEGSRNNSSGGGGGGDCDVTCVDISAAAVATMPSLLDVEAIYVSGGGVHNKTMMKALTEGLAPLPVLPFGALGDAANADAREAVAFAILANETVMGNAGNLCSATGAKAQVSLGKICLAL